jgi:signal transduction histidine kinase/DNA-binding response OmpR family regulator
MSWYLSKKITIGFLIAFLIILIVGIESFRTIHNFRLTKERELKSRKILSQLEDVLSTVKDLESGHRGFVITERESYLVPYNYAISSIHGEIKELKLLLDNNNTQLKNLDSLEQLINKKIELTNGLIALRKNKGFEAALQEVLTDKGIVLMDTIRRLTNEMIQYENESFQDTFDIEVSSGDNTIDIIILGNVVALLFLIIALFILNHDIKHRIRVEGELQIAKQAAEDANKIQEQFLANMSHEIRTPMNAVVGMSNLILQSELQPKQLEYMKAIKQSSDNLLIIINDILDFSKIRAGKIEIECIDFRLSDLLQGLYNTFKFKVEEKNLQFIHNIDTSLPDVILGDPVRLNQIFINLIGNAIKFTEVGSITIECLLLNKNADSVTIQFNIKDTGIGINENKLSTIFESFSQATSDTTRKYGGTGLGLTISKQLIEIQGGEIEVKSTLNVGTTFGFHLTFTIGSETNLKDFKIQKVNTTNLKGIKILLVEDNLFNQVVAVDTLNLLIKNLEIDIAENGKIALDKVSKKQYDILLMDVHMPYLDGYETTKAIRSSGTSYSEVPIMAMTASATTEEVQKCYKSGMNDCIAKPFDPNVLMQKISALLSKTVYEKEEMQEYTPSDETKITDLTFLKKLTGDNDAYTIKYIDLMIESIPNDLVELNKYCLEQQWSNVSGIAHTMKPKVNYIGVKEGLEIVAKLERYGRDEVHTDMIPELISALEKILKIAIEELEIEKKNLL